eukprot:CAMPEP_0177268176 /NCGR_PEP_ID=MMETSP0367-20130122/63668_1 /TAXON_ID=447022 ORGANISM="Scrippsiella hangoei-like, Strain SHHI-4" /NCGR_SAMPLE_ID=MMETSP0367 /ASSEMBLY_ACC=CAM_ASM_000362 /LENGTH=147 /DNA_ID=CAMNT_0018723775 /DNA_START=88 /DNA_END=528 /DNA_ORIENTATION=-
MPLVKTCSRKLSSASSATSSVIPSGDAAGRTALFPVPSSSLSQLLVWCPMVMREQPRVVAIDGKLEAQRQGGVPQPGRPPPRRCIRFEDHEPQVLEDTLHRLMVAIPARVPVRAKRRVGAQLDAVRDKVGAQKQPVVGLRAHRAPCV